MKRFSPEAEDRIVRATNGGLIETVADEWWAGVSDVVAQSLPLPDSVPLDEYTIAGLCLSLPRTLAILDMDTARSDDLCADLRRFARRVSPLVEKMPDYAWSAEFAARAADAAERLGLTWERVDAILADMGLRFAVAADLIDDGSPRHEALAAAFGTSTN